MDGSTFDIDIGAIDRLQKALKEYQGNTETMINDVLHAKPTSQLIQESIRKLMPKSEVKPWKNKLPHAIESKSMRDEKDNLTLTVKNSKQYHYLYFPDNGTNTVKHRGEQHFFLRGGEKVQDEIIDRCIDNIIKNFEAIATN